MDTIVGILSGESYNGIHALWIYLCALNIPIVIELKIPCIVTGYFVGLTSIENSQIQFGKVPRWTHTGDEARHMINSK